MNKKRVWTVTATLLLVIVIFATNFMFSGCDLFKKQTTYIYTDAVGEHSITVDFGELLNVDDDSLPLKDGYTFLGWFDSEMGGTKYVDANGKGLSTPSKKGEFKLYTQYEALEFAIQLYAPVGTSGLEQDYFSVKYNTEMPKLPANLTLAHKKFIGYFTNNNGKGTQVTRGDTYLPNMDTLTHDYYRLSDASRIVNLYAAFEDEVYAVTFKFGSDYKDETVYVPYGTPLNSIMYQTRNDEGFAMTAWSLSEGGAVYNKPIEGETVLYAVGDWAPAIELNSNGGELNYLIVAASGTPITLPTPTKTAAKFLGWKTDKGEDMSYTSMPETSTKLIASWKGMLEFDSNGGTAVDNISEDANTKITLPIPTREGYAFAGWYTEEDSVLYTETIMPYEGVKLIAGWARPLQKEIKWATDSSNRVEFPYDNWEEASVNKPGGYIIGSVSDLKGRPTYIHTELHLECNHYKSQSIFSTSDGWGNLWFAYHSAETGNEKYRLSEAHCLAHEKVQGWKSYDISDTFLLPDGQFCISMWCTGNDYVWIRNVKVVITYPDMTTLEL